MKKEIKYIGRVIYLVGKLHIKADKIFEASTKEEIQGLISLDILSQVGKGVVGCIIGYTKETSIEFEGDEYINEKNSIEFYGDLTQEQMDDLQASYLDKISNEVIW
jgi:hypothetical protein